jgi:hypothetical protein
MKGIVCFYKRENRNVDGNFFGVVSIRFNSSSVQALYCNLFHLRMKMDLRSYPAAFE